tara:strand:- start:129 stop:368 length:240 start_codon:yes stop_codon:yes gene_type:complete
MLETIKISSFCKDLFKIVVGIKLLTFIAISGIEGIESIKELIDTNHCVETMSEGFKSEKNQHPKAKAVHFCSGGITFQP